MNGSRSRGVGIPYLVALRNGGGISVNTGDKRVSQNHVPVNKRSPSTLVFLWKHLSWTSRLSYRFALAWLAVEPCSNLACTTRYERQEEKLLQS